MRTLPALLLPLALAACSAAGPTNPGTADTAAFRASPELQGRTDRLERLKEVVTAAEGASFRALVPQCVRALRGKAVDTAFLRKAGYAPKSTLTGRRYWLNQIRPAGFMRYEEAVRFHPRTGRECTIEKSAGSVLRGFRGAAEGWMVAEGFRPTGATTGLGRWPVMERDGLRVRVQTGVTRESGASYITLKRL